MFDMSGTEGSTGAGARSTLRLTTAARAPVTIGSRAERPLRLEPAHRGTGADSVARSANRRRLRARPTAPTAGVALFLALILLLLPPPPPAFAAADAAALDELSLRIVGWATNSAGNRYQVVHEYVHDDLRPAFDPGVHDYALRVSGRAQRIEVGARAARFESADPLVSVGDGAARADYSSRWLDLADEVTTIPIVVTNGAARRTYTVEVTRGASGDPGLTLSAAPAPAEGGGAVTVTAKLLGEPAPAGGTTVTLTVSGTATRDTGSGGDYVLSSTTIAIAEGETRGTATITVTDDAVADGDETIVLSAAGTNPALFSNPLTLRVADNDPAVLISSVVSGRGDTHDFVNRLAVRFTTGDNAHGYTLTSIGVRLTKLPATPSDLRVELWRADADKPGAKIVDLAAPDTFAVGVMDFTAPRGTMLEASTGYFAVYYLTDFKERMTNPSSNDRICPSCGRIPSASSWPAGDDGWAIERATYYDPPLNTAYCSDDPAPANAPWYNQYNARVEYPYCKETGSSQQIRVMGTLNEEPAPLGGNTQPPPPVTLPVMLPVTPSPGGGAPIGPVQSSDASLSALSLSAGWLAFAPQTSAYATAVPYAVAGVTVTPTANHGGATVTVNGVAVPNGEPSAPVALAAGEETLIEVVVTAASGATRTYTVTVTRGPAEVAFLPGASGALHGFVRVVNESDEAGEVTVRAFDDAGEEYDPLTLALGAGAAVQLGARDLESGNPDKGLTGATGPGQGHWRLVFESDLAFRALGYVRTREAEGFPAAVHDVVAESRTAEGYRYEVVFFNPASNVNQASALRLVNRSDTEASVTVTGTDDAGRAGEAAVTLTLPAGAARRLNAPALESGEGEGLDGALGDGAGKWRLGVDSDRPLGVMSLMRSLDGHLTNLSTAPGGVERLWLLPSAANAVRYGFVRIVDESDEAGEVRIRAFDDTGEEYDPVTLALGAGAAVQLGSRDIESGNAHKGLTGATGPGQGRWRLAFESAPGVRVLGYVRNHGAAGLPASVHDVVAESRTEEGYRYEVAFFNPASNANQASVLLLENRSDAEAAEVTITGTDDAGDAGDAAVTLTLPAGASRRLWAPALESGEGEGLDGALGDGAGKWRLGVDSDRPLAVMSLMRSLDGHLTNLSTAPPASR